MVQPPLPILAFAPLQFAAMPAVSRRVLTKLARTRSVFVVEPAERVEKGDREFWELNCGAPDLLACRPRIANPTGIATRETRVRMARALLYWLDIDAFVALLYAASEVPIVRSLTPSLVIHDRSFDRVRPRAAARRAAIARAPLIPVEASGA